MLVASFRTSTAPLCVVVSGCDILWASFFISYCHFRYDFIFAHLTPFVTVIIENNHLFIYSKFFKPFRLSAIVYSNVYNQEIMHAAEEGLNHSHSKMRKQ